MFALLLLDLAQPVHLAWRALFLLAAVGHRWYSTRNHHHQTRNRRRRESNYFGKTMLSRACRPMFSVVVSPMGFNTRLSVKMSQPSRRLALGRMDRT